MYWIQFCHPGWCWDPGLWTVTVNQKVRRPAGHTEFPARNQDPSHFGDAECLGKSHSVTQTWISAVLIFGRVHFLTFSCCGTDSEVFLQFILPDSTLASVRGCESWVQIWHKHLQCSQLPQIAHIVMSIDCVTLSQSCCSLCPPQFKIKTPKKGMWVATFVHTHLGLGTSLFSTLQVASWRF